MNAFFLNKMHGFSSTKCMGHNESSIVIINVTLLILLVCQSVGEYFKL